MLGNNRAVAAGAGVPIGNESPVSAVSWAAIFSGALAAIATTLVLVALAAGLGLTTISAWPGVGASATSFTIGTGVGLIVVQWLSSGLGGYVTGRLRTKWVGVHSHEVFFRDTAHGFLAWALATALGTVVIASAVSAGVSGGVQAVAAVGGAAAPLVNPYVTDQLFRSDKADNAADNADTAAQATRILANAVRPAGVAPADRTWLAQQVSARTGLSQADAEKRVDDAIGQVKAAADEARNAAEAARKATASFAIFSALALAVGAFIASAAAAYGGAVRDEY
jgi:hypothetical protein